MTAVFTIYGSYTTIDIKKEYTLAIETSLCCLISFTGYKILEEGCEYKMRTRGTETCIYKGDEAFIFVSYSHTDIRTVEGILRLLSAQGFRLWYDQEIDAGKNWQSVIDERLHNSRAFLIFLGNGSQDRPEVMRELEIATEKQESDPSYVILPVFLNRIPIEDFPEKVRPVLLKNQNIGLWRYGGVTDQFVRRIVYTESWPEEVVDNAERAELGLPEWKPSRTETTEIEFHPEEPTDYVYRYVVPILAEKESEGKRIRYYKVSPGDISPHAVYPFVMDNQWCPVSFYKNEEFREKGLTSLDLGTVRERIQRKEICRGLLHARQLLVNRAFLQNSGVFIHWYTANGTEEYASFCRLLEQGALILVLFKEQMPCEETTYENANWEAWKQLCAEHVTYCLRMDWEDDRTNEMETDKLLSLPFHNYCVTTAGNKYRIEEMVNAFALSETDAEKMRRKWKQIQHRAIRIQEETGKWYTRNQFYADYIIKKNTKVVDCCISQGKRFARELKQMIDMRYNLNFAEAYGIKPMLPGDIQVNPVLVDKNSAASVGREVSAEELIYAVGSFHPEIFLEDMPMIENPDLNLTQVETMRNLTQWQKYIRFVEGADNRGKQWDIDFSYIRAVWEEYRKWVEAAWLALPELKWKKGKGAVTILYRIGEKEIITVFRQGEDRPFIIENELRPMNRKQVLSIDYICGDIFECGTENCLFTEIRLFEGWTHETGVYLYEKLKDRLCGGRCI